MGGKEGARSFKIIQSGQGGFENEIAFLELMAKNGIHKGWIFVDGKNKMLWKKAREIAFCFKKRHFKLIVKKGKFSEEFFDSLIFLFPSKRIAALSVKANSKAAQLLEKIPHWSSLFLNGELING